MRLHPLVLPVSLILGITTLFAGILIALYQNHMTGERLDRNDARQCMAIQGALGYWKTVRISIIKEIHDPRSNVATQVHDQQILLALNHVISKGEGLSC